MYYTARFLTTRVTVQGGIFTALPLMPLLAYPYGVGKEWREEKKGAQACCAAVLT